MSILELISSDRLLWNFSNEVYFLCFFVGDSLGQESHLFRILKRKTILYDYMNYFDGDANLLCGCDIENQNREDSI